jgi:hypothetical protein
LGSSPAIKVHVDIVVSVAVVVFVVAPVDVVVVLDGDDHE